MQEILGANGRCGPHRVKACPYCSGERAPAPQPAAAPTPPAPPSRPRGERVLPLKPPDRVRIVRSPREPPPDTRAIDELLRPVPAPAPVAAPVEAAPLPPETCATCGGSDGLHLRADCDAETRAADGAPAAPAPMCRHCGKRSAIQWGRWAGTPLDAYCTTCRKNAATRVKKDGGNPDDAEAVCAVLVRWHELREATEPWALAPVPRTRARSAVASATPTATTTEAPASDASAPVVETSSATAEPGAPPPPLPPPPTTILRELPPLAGVLVYLSPPALELLDRLVATGLYGTDRSEACEAFVRAGIVRHLSSGILDAVERHARGAA